jgi:hypothetical protein
VAQTIDFGTKEKPINVEFSENHNEFFVDGAAGLAIGYPMSKMVLTSTEPHNTVPNTERRRAVCTVAFTTEAMIDIAKMIIANVSQNRDFLEANSIEAAKRISEALDSIKHEPGKPNS